MKKKKILYINKQYREYDYLKYVTLFKEFDLTVFWICPFRNSEYLPSYIKKNIKYLILGFKGDRIQPWHIFYNIKFLKIMMKYGKSVDIIISSTSDAWHSKLAFIISILYRKPIVFRKEVWYRIGGLYNRFNYFITSYIEKNSKGVFYQGIQQKNFLMINHVRNDKLFLFPQLIKDLRNEKINEKIINDFRERYKNKFIFIFVGRIIPQKGLDILIEAFSRLEKSYNNILLLVVGGPSRGGYHKESSQKYYRYCKELASKKAKNIYFIGEVNSSMIQNYYYLADVFVHPHKKYISKKKPVWEGWGNVIVEATSMGLPLIVTDRVSSAFEMIENGKNGIIVDSDNLEENLYDAMKFFLHCRDRIHKFKEKSREIFEKYNNPTRVTNSINSVLVN